MGKDSFMGWGVLSRRRSRRNLIGVCELERARLGHHRFCVFEAGLIEMRQIVKPVERPLPQIVLSKDCNPSGRNKEIH